MDFFGKSSVANITHGEGLAVMAAMPDSSVNLVLCDPPYGTTDCDGDTPINLPTMWAQCARVLAPRGCVVLFGSQPYTSELVMSNPEWFRYELIWDKNKCGSPGLAKIRPMKVHENILVFSPGAHVYNPIMEEGEPYSRKSSKPEGYVGKINRHGYGMKPRTEFTNTGTRYPKSIRHVSRDFSAQQQVHQHQKPLALMEWLALTYSNLGDLVVDFAMGSGTTGLACLNTGRNFIGMELKRPAFDSAVKRFAEWA
jgi:site-specific DNA-methyltransferase (adenine-specific)